jgi:hypothetical protein
MVVTSNGITKEFLQFLLAAVLLPKLPMKISQQFDRNIRKQGL